MLKTTLEKNETKNKYGLTSLAIKYQVDSTSLTKKEEYQFNSEARAMFGKFAIACYKPAGWFSPNGRRIKFISHITDINDVIQEGIVGLIEYLQKGKFDSESGSISTISGYIADDKWIKYLARDSCLFHMSIKNYYKVGANLNQNPYLTIKLDAQKYSEFNESGNSNQSNENLLEISEGLEASSPSLFPEISLNTAQRNENLMKIMEDPRLTMLEKNVFLTSIVHGLKLSECSKYNDLSYNQCRNLLPRIKNKLEDKLEEFRENYLD